jgi:adenylate cyclase
MATTPREPGSRPFSPARQGPLGRSDSIAARLLRQADVDAERLAALTRIIAAFALFVLVEFIILDQVPQAQANTRSHVLTARLFLGILLTLGILSYYAAREGWGGPWRPFVTLTADAALILTNLWYALTLDGLPGSLFPTMPIVWAIPLAFGMASIHYRPGLQAYVAGLYLLGVPFVVWLAGHADPAERLAALSRTGPMFGWPPNSVRWLMLAATAGALVLATWRGRSLLERAVTETVRRAAFSRFLPAEVAESLTAPARSDLRDGRRQQAAIVFVDIRDFTRRSEELDPARISIFISSFRRRVSQAARAHGGVVDKFVGDGALIVFGLPEPAADDAARALAFGADLAARVERWNAKRAFDPPIRVGIGAHYGEVYCGLIGDQSRLEFTVLGDTVNVAARLEQSTKSVGRDRLASEALLMAAGQMAAWEQVAHEPLRGRQGSLRIFAPKEPVPAPVSDQSPVSVLRS